MFFKIRKAFNIAIVAVVLIGAILCLLSGLIYVALGLFLIGGLCYFDLSYRLKKK